MDWHRSALRFLRVGLAVENAIGFEADDPVMAKEIGKSFLATASLMTRFGQHRTALFKYYQAFQQFAFVLGCLARTRAGSRRSVAKAVDLLLVAIIGIGQLFYHLGRLEAGRQTLAIGLTISRDFHEAGSEMTAFLADLVFHFDARHDRLADERRQFEVVLVSQYRRFQDAGGHRDADDRHESLHEACAGHAISRKDEVGLLLELFRRLIDDDIDDMPVTNEPAAEAKLKPALKSTRRSMLRSSAFKIEAKHEYAKPGSRLADSRLASRQSTAEVTAQVSSRSVWKDKSTVEVRNYDHADFEPRDREDGSLRRFVERVAVEAAGVESPAKDRPSMAAFTVADVRHRKTVNIDRMALTSRRQARVNSESKDDVANVTMVDPKFSMGFAEAVNRCRLNRRHRPADTDQRTEDSPGGGRLARDLALKILGLLRAKEKHDEDKNKWLNAMLRHPHVFRLKNFLNNRKDAADRSTDVARLEPSSGPKWEKAKADQSIRSAMDRLVVSSHEANDHPSGRSATGQTEGQADQGQGRVTGVAVMRIGRIDGAAFFVQTEDLLEPGAVAASHAHAATGRQPLGIVATV